MLNLATDSMTCLQHSIRTLAWHSALTSQWHTSVLPTKVGNACHSRGCVHNHCLYCRWTSWPIPCCWRCRGTAHCDAGHRIRALPFPTYTWWCSQAVRLGRLLFGVRGNDMSGHYIYRSPDPWSTQSGTICPAVPQGVPTPSGWPSATSCGSA